MGEFEFRHYLSNHHCKTEKTHRNVSVPIDGPNGHRLFRLSEETGIAFLIHHEPEDQLIPPLEKMLKTYPKAKVIWAHFGQVRNPELSKSFGPRLVRHLLDAYPNLYFDLATGRPNQIYACNNLRGYGVIWAQGKKKQIAKLKPAYKAILSNYSTRFVVGFDYGGGRVPMQNFLFNVVRNIRAIMDGLPKEAKHNIDYRNAWMLLTGKPWD